MRHLQYLWLTYPTMLIGAAAAPRPQETSATAMSTTANAAGATATTAVSSSTTTATPSQQNACSEIAGMVAGKNISQGVFISAALAWDCLQSVPLQADSAVSWLESMRPYIDWQSTLVYLADPPVDYPQPAINIFDGLDAVISDVQNGKHTNEYSLEMAVYSLVHRAHDGHFDYIPNLLDKVFYFGRPLALVSYALDSCQGLAKQYVYNDVLLSMTLEDFEPSAITHINGMDSVTYLENWSKTGVSQDPDALWNSVFFSLATGSLGSIQYTTGDGLFAGGGNANIIYPGANTTLQFENGTTTVIQNFAKVLQSFKNIRSGSDVFNQYVVPTTTTPYVLTPLPTVTQIPGYPSPIVIQGNGLDSGYYLDGEGYEDVAVLSVPTFEALDISFGPYSGLDFSDAAYEFIDQAKADGKKKLIVDVSANGGGTISLGYTLFLKLFPDIVPYLGQRIRATNTINIIGQAISSVIDAPGYNRTNRTTEIELGTLLSTPMDYQNDLDVSGNKFPSWPAKFGPHMFHDDNFTSTFRYNESGFDTAGINSTRPFDVENVILLTDGNCASTCSIFAELLTQQAGVKTVVVGGRPNQEPMQALGATKGAQAIGWTNIYDWVNSTLGILTENHQSASDVAVLEQYNELPLNRASVASVNFRDQLRQDDADQTPLQFVYEAADCRILNTKPMLINIAALWKEVYDVTWSGKKCLVGGL